MSHFEVQKPKEPSPLFIQSRWLLGKSAWFITEKAFNTENLSPESLQNIEKANHLLKKHSGIFYINHVKATDPLLIPLALSSLPNAKNLMGPAGLKHFDEERAPLSARIFRALRHLHIVFLPVLQKNDKESSRYTPEEIALMSNQLRVLSEEAIGTPGNVIGIAPEGTRYPDNILRKAYPGIGFYEQYHDPRETFYTPIALLYPPHTQKPTITIGAPAFLPEILSLDSLPKGKNTQEAKERAKKLTTAHMQRLAVLLPPENRGFYASIESS